MASERNPETHPPFITSSSYRPTPVTRLQPTRTVNLIKVKRPAKNASIGVGEDTGMQLCPISQSNVAALDDDHRLKVCEDETIYHLPDIYKWIVEHQHTTWPHAPSTPIGIRTFKRMVEKYRKLYDSNLITKKIPDLPAPNHSKEMTIENQIQRDYTNANGAQSATGLATTSAASEEDQSDTNETNSINYTMEWPSTAIINGMECSYFPPRRGEREPVFKLFIEWENMPANFRFNIPNPDVLALVHTPWHFRHYQFTNEIQDTTNRILTNMMDTFQRFVSHNDLSILRYKSTVVMYAGFTPVGTDQYDRSLFFAFEIVMRRAESAQEYSYMAAFRYIINENKCTCCIVHYESPGPIYLESPQTIFNALMEAFDNGFYRRSYQNHMALYKSRMPLVTRGGARRALKTSNKESEKHKYKGRLYTVRTGERGGRYIVSSGKKIYF